MGSNMGGRMGTIQASIPYGKHMGTEWGAISHMGNSMVNGMGTIQESMSIWESYGHRMGTEWGAFLAIWVLSNMGGCMGTIQASIPYRKHMGTEWGAFSHMRNSMVNGMGTIQESMTIWESYGHQMGSLFSHMGIGRGRLIGYEIGPYGYHWGAGWRLYGVPYRRLYGCHMGDPYGSRMVIFLPDG